MSEVLLLEKLRDVEEQVKERTSGIRWAVVLSVLNMVLNATSVLLLYMIYSVLAHGAVHAGAAVAQGQQIAVIGGGK